MNKEEIFQKLTQLFASKIDYSGELNSLFLMETERGKLKINFLNNQHYEYILKHLKNDILTVVGDDVILRHFNLKTTPITLKQSLQEEGENVLKPAPVRPKEKVELNTIKNKTIKEIESFMFDECEKIFEQQKEIRELDDDYLNNIRYAANFGQITFIATLYEWMKKVKDYEED